MGIRSVLRSAAGRGQGSLSQPGRSAGAWSSAARLCPRRGAVDGCHAGSSMPRGGLKDQEEPAEVCHLYGARVTLSGRNRRHRKSVPKCSGVKYGVWASGMRTRASAGRAEIGLVPWFLRSVLDQLSQEIRRELASGERFSPVCASGQSTAFPQKPQETCHSARRSVGRREGRLRKLAEGVRPGSNRR